MRLGKIIDFLVYSNLYVAIPIVCITAFTYWLQHLALDYIFLCFVFSATLFLYNLHRFYGLIKRQNKALTSDRFVWAFHNKRTLFGISLSALLFCLVLLPGLKLVTILALLPTVFLSLLYVLPFIPHQGKFKRMRDLPFIKVFVISITVTYLTYVVPVYINHEEINPYLLYSRFFFILGITIPFDIRDFYVDIKEKVKTIPTEVGIPKAKLLAAASLLISLVLFAITDVTDETIVAVILGYSVCFLSLIPLDANRKHSDSYFAFLFEGSMIYIPLLAYSSSLL